MDKLRYVRKEMYERFHDQWHELHVPQPERKHPTDAGVDVCTVEDVTLWPLQTKIISTGLYLDIPDGYVVQVWPKSRHDWLIGAGIIDSGYRGEILVKIVNASLRIRRIKAGTQVAQIVLLPVATPTLEEVSMVDYRLRNTKRGGTGGITTQAGG